MGLTSAPLPGSVSQALSVGERCDFDCVKSGNTRNTKLECVAEISTSESELVRENKVKRFLWQHSSSFVTQLITRENPDTKGAEQSPRSLTENTFTLCMKVKSVLGAENKQCSGRQMMRSSATDALDRIVEEQTALGRRETSSAQGGVGTKTKSARSSQAFRV